MKIGIICEGGADGKVYEYLVKLISPDDTPKSLPLGNKLELIAQCGDAAKALLEIDHFERVIIIWDLESSWMPKKQRACRKNDCDLIKASLQDASLDEKQWQQVYLVCMEKELETLFLADEQAISEYLTRKPKPPCRVKHFKHPERPPNPKKELSQIFKMHRERKYEDFRDAEKLIRFVNIKNLRRCASFIRFENIVVKGVTL
jgi:hypothetical protein